MTHRFWWNRVLLLEIWSRDIKTRVGKEVVDRLGRHYASVGRGRDLSVVPSAGVAFSGSWWSCELEYHLQ